MQNTPSNDSWLQIRDVFGGTCVCMQANYTTGSAFGFHPTRIRGCRVGEHERREGGREGSGWGIYNNPRKEKQPSRGTHTRMHDLNIRNAGHESKNKSRQTRFISGGGGEARERERKRKKKTAFSLSSPMFQKRRTYPPRPGGALCVFM